MLALAISLAPAAAPLGPPPSVELRVSSADDGEAMLLEQLLVRRLGDRLLEDGYRVVPVGEEASVSVWIHLEPAGARIEARGTQSRVESVAPGKPQVVALEIQQLTSAIIDELRVEVEPSSPAVVVEMVGVLADPQLREVLQAGLLDRGHALTRDPREGDLRLCVSPSEEGMKVAVVDAQRACVDEGTLADAGSPGGGLIPIAESEDLQREYLLGGASAALRAWEVESTSSIEPVVADPVVADPVVPVQAPAPVLDAELEPAPGPELEPEPELVLTLAPFGGVLGRFGGLDLAAGLRLRMGRRRGLGAALQLLLVPSRAVGVRVFESIPTASLDWRIGFARRGAVALAAYGGAHFHNYVETQGRDARGLKVGPTGGASARLLYLGAGGVTLFGGVHGGWSGQRWSYTSAEDKNTWSRAPLTLGGELGIAWDIGVRGRT